MPSIDGLSFRHIYLEGGLAGFYRLDQVHLSDIANDILNLNFQFCIELAVARVGCQACLSWAWHVGIVVLLCSKVGSSFNSWTIGMLLAYV